MAWVNPRRDAILASQGDDGSATLCNAPASASDRQPPQSDGQLIAEFDRPGKRFGKPDEVLRLEIAEFSGHKFLSLRVWTKNAQGELWPSPTKGLSVKTREARDLAAALIEAANLIEDEAPDEPAPRRSAPSRGQTPSQRAGQAPARSGGGGTFSREDRQLPPTPDAAADPAIRNTP